MPVIGTGGREGKGEGEGEQREEKGQEMKGCVDWERRIVGETRKGGSTWKRDERW